jgi:glycosyltransferase involved in cell wall biosynthesis
VSQVLHILHVFSTFKIGGPQVRFAALVEGLGDAISHSVIAMDGNYTAAGLLPPSAKVAIDEKPLAGGSLLGRLKRYRREIRARAPDLLITYNWGAIEWALANASLDTPHIHLEDGFGPEEANRQFARRVWIRRLALRRSEVIVPSLVLRDMALRVWRLAESRLHYIPNGIVPRDHARTDIGSLGLNLPRGMPRIVFAGALRPEKNLVRLLRAYALIKNDAALLIIGDGSEIEKLVREAERLSLGPHLHFLGRREDVRDIVMQCDIMAISSDTEQMPLVVLEGMDAGLPIVSTRVGDIERVVAPENRPYIVKRSDLELGAAMGALVADPAARKAVGAANRRRVRRDFLASDMIAAYGQLFRKAAQAGIGRPRSHG